MSHPLDYFPDTYSQDLFAALDLLPGDEVLPGNLEPLFAFQKQWTGEVGNREFVYDADLLTAYTLYYMTINMPKLWFMLDRCGPLLDALLAEKQELRVTELGCGPGTFLWALTFYLQARRPDWGGTLVLNGVDREPAFLEIAQRLASVFSPKPVTFVTGDWQDSLKGETDLLIIGNTVHEQANVDLKELAESPARAIIVVEPGTLESFQRLRPWRDQLLASQWQSHFPCPSAATCPMSADNWCHFHINRFVLPFIQRMSGKAMRLNPKHHFTGFVFSRLPADQQSTWRVMSNVRKANRSAIRYLCDGKRLVETVLNRQGKSESNVAFTEAETGDLIRYLPGKQGRALHGTRKLFVDDRVEIVAPGKSR